MKISSGDRQSIINNAIAPNDSYDTLQNLIEAVRPSQQTTFTARLFETTQKDVEELNSSVSKSAVLVDSHDWKFEFKQTRNN